MCNTFVGKLGDATTNRTTFLINFNDPMVSGDDITGIHNMSFFVNNFESLQFSVLNLILSPKI